MNQSASSCPEATHLSRERDTEYIKMLDVEGFSRPILKIPQTRKLTIEGGPSLSPKVFGYRPYAEHHACAALYLDNMLKSRDITLPTKVCPSRL